MKGNVSLFCAALMFFGVGVSSGAFAAPSCGGTSSHSVFAFQGELSGTNRYAHPFGDGYVVFFAPVELGWDIAMRDPAGAELPVIVPASGIPQSLPRFILGPQFWNAVERESIFPQPVLRRFVFGADVRNPELYPELNIVPGAIPTAPMGLGRGEVEILDYGLADLGGDAAARLVYLKFHACLEVQTPLPSLTDLETLEGVYRSGFEASDFHIAGESGRWRLMAEGENWESLQSYLIERPGRGSGVTVAVTLTGRRTGASADLDHLGRYEGEFHVEGINAVRAISPEEFVRLIDPLPQP